MAIKPLPPVEFLRECFSYDPGTGKLRWRRRPVSHFPTLDSAKSWNAQYAGRLALTTDYEGHARGEVRIDGQRTRLYAHRVIFKLMTGRDPVEQIDHINGVGSDNRWANLREASGLDNARNRRDPTRPLPKCVYAEGRKFVAKAYGEGRRRVRLGSFDTPAEAHAAYVAFAGPLHGEFFNPGPGVETIFD